MSTKIKITVLNSKFDVVKSGLTVGEVAKFLQASEVTIYKASKGGWAVNGHYLVRSGSHESINTVLLRAIKAGLEGRDPEGVKDALKTCVASLIKLEKV